MDLFDRSSMQDRSIYVHGSLRRTCTKCTRSCCVFKNCWFCLNKMCLSIRFCDLLFVYGICSMLELEPSHFCGNCTLLEEPWTSHLFGESKLCIWTVFPAFEGIISLTGSAILDLKLSTSMVIFMALDAALRLMVLELEPQSSAIICRVVAIGFDSYVHNARYYLATFINFIFGYLQSTCFVVVIVVLCCAAEQFCSMIIYYYIYIHNYSSYLSLSLREQLYLVVQDADFMVLKEDWGMTQHPPHKENKSSYHEVLVIALRLVVVVKKQEKKKQTGKAENRKAEKQRVRKAKEKQRKEREKQTKYIKKQEDSNSRKREQRRR